MWSGSKYDFQVAKVLDQDWWELTEKAAHRLGLPTEMEHNCWSFFYVVNNMLLNQPIKL